jgi:hypothetical protein
MEKKNVVLCSPLRGANPGEERRDFPLSVNILEVIRFLSP